LRYFIEPRPAPAPDATQVAPPAIANGNGSAARADGVEDLVRAQLELMSRQLAALAAEPSATE